ncbi:MAG TPA: hypothetical protein VFG68_11640 [Fimbriiglobus sp.]|nr:hypothetical protein [Fimbriiglobus sp.]
MIDSTPCPDASTLFRLRIGRIPDPLATQLREHLATCPRCARAPGGAGPAGHRLQSAQGGAPAGGPTAVVTPRPVGSGAGGLLRPPEQPGELGRLGGYRVLRLLGEDGSGGVYEAVHPRQGVRVALQVVPARSPGAERARQRAQSSADGTCEVGEDNGALFVATALPDAPSAAQVARGPRYCPRCLGDLRELGGKAWCAKCGYSSDDDEQPQQADPGPRGVPYWLIVFLVGCVGIVVATAMRREILPAGSKAQVWWILYEAGFGLLAYLVGHVMAVVLTFRHWRDGELFKYIDPLTAGRYAIEFLPRTRYAICLAVWGAIAFLFAFILFWMNDFAFKDKKAKPKTVVAHRVITTGDGEAPPEDPEAGDFILYGDDVMAEDTKIDRDVALFDPYGDPDPPERQEPPNVSSCVVIGYVPDPNDPNRVAELVLGTRDADGTIRYVGTVGNFARTGEVDQGVSRVKGLTPLLEKPGYLPDGLNVIPVEPSMTARVGYTERDAQGQMKGATLKGFSKPDAATP